MKKILILTVTAGNGHNSNAKAVSNKLKDLEGDNIEVKIIDILKEYAKPKYFWITNNGYTLAMTYLPNTYDFFYNVYKRKSPNKRYKNAGQKIPLTILDKLYKEINEYQPDAIYCTHFYGAIALSDLKLAYELPCKTIVANLDFVNSPFWEDAINIDYFVVPNTDFVEESIEEGFKKEQLLPYGIPIKEQFFEIVDKKEARNQLGIDENKFTIMVLFGGGCWSGGYKIFKNLIKVCKNEDVQIIMINGHNENSFYKIENSKFPNNIKIVNVGFTDKVDLYMSASDVIVSKSGGMGLSEIINKLKPMIITNKVYGQEKHNLKYLKQKEIAYSFKNKKQLKILIDKFKNDEIFYNKTVENISKLKINGLESLVHLLLTQPKPEYNEEYIKNINYNKVILNVKKAMHNENKIAKAKK